ncbi:hypothetical protein JB92DRAFT_2914786 [Gautieria morchelliformis]|nr:hypothetical protein JB92DRAFT_2914786 [Gautieria morchelliformis]
MDSTSSSTASHRRTFDLPKSSPDAGLAEWTSKIKAIQQEVDRDEEAEQRRLQEEIAKSRLDRARRRNTATGSIDWTKRAASPLGEPPEEMQSHTDQKQHQSDAPSKLSESTLPAKGSLNTLISSTSKQEGTSLAAFMGGRATGPRLNKPAPQVDSHDPTLFDQTRRIGPHPVFGRSSDALAAAGRFAVKPQSAGIKTPQINPSESRPSTSSISATSQAPVISLSQTVDDVTKSSPEIPKKPAILRKSSEKTVHTSEIPREVESSTQRRPPPEISTKPKLPGPSGATIPPKHTSLAAIIGGNASAPHLTRHSVGDPSDSVASSDHQLSTRGRALPGMSDANRVNSPPAVTSTSPMPISSLSSSQWDATSDTRSGNPNIPLKRSPSGSMIVTPSLARPLQPQITVQPSPIPATSLDPSPAFLRVTPSTQDLHPSLSRLQGRGFVEQRVKESSQLHGVSPGQQRDRISSSGSSPQRPTALDRWQSTSPSPPASTSNKPSGQRDVTNRIHGVSPPTPSQQVIRPRTISPGLVKPGVEGAVTERAAPVRLPGMASSTSFPPRQWTPVNPRPATDPEGKREGAHRDQRDMSNVTGPLSHPTRDRARKPRKEPGPSKTDTGKSLSAVRIQSKGDSRGEDKTVKLAQRVPSPEAKRQPSPSVLNNIQRLKDTLTYQPPVDASVPAISISTVQPRPTNGVTSALEATSQCPALSMQETAPSPLIAPRPMTPASPTSSLDEHPMTPSRHSRIPSTGQRATVMDVAHALQQHEQHIRETSWTPEPEPEPREVPARQETLSGNDVVDEAPRADVKAAIAGWGRNFVSGGQQTERRRSSYDRFSGPTLPPLVEEKTPAATPQGSLSRGFTQVEQSAPRIKEINTDLQESVSEAFIPITAVEVEPPKSKPEQELVPEAEREPKPNSLVHLEHYDRLPPAFNLQSVLNEVPFSPDLSLQTISVDIFTIFGHTAVAVTREPNVFYDSEVVVIVQRAKKRSGHLVSNKVWVWRGKNANFGEKEDRKAKELAERFGTTGSCCFHGSEPPSLIHAVGGVLAIRQGVRAHWSSENTAMHRVHRVGDSLFVDEVDLNVSNLCSAYSYCLSVLGAIYVWHGRGASEDERKVALTYGQSLTSASSGLIELEEGKEDEMFWMVLGNGGYANADHWKFKGQLDRLGARIHIIDCNKVKSPVQALSSVSARDLPDDSVFVFDCSFEVFVVVHPNARGKRTDIQLGLIVAENISMTAAAKRPFDPPIHVVILPSQLPKELRACIRLCDEEKLNGGSTPDHMNLLPLREALDHMHQSNWPRSVLSDPTFLPLGVAPAML